MAQIDPVNVQIKVGTVREGAALLKVDDEGYVMLSQADVDRIARAVVAILDSSAD